MPVDSMGEGGDVVLGEVGGTTVQPGKFTVSQSWMHVDFQSAKDPSWEERNPGFSTCVVTIEADDDFVIKPSGEGSSNSSKMFQMVGGAGGAKVREELKGRVLEDLVRNFPTCEGKVVGAWLGEVSAQGLSHDPNRFAANCVKPGTPFGNLFLGGLDVTYDSFVGGLAAGYLTANAVLGYTAFDQVVLGKSLVADLVAGVGGSGGHGKGEAEEAVPFTEKIVVE